MWILIILIGQIGAGPAEFTSQARCEAARDQVRAFYTADEFNQARARVWAERRIFCVEK